MQAVELGRTVKLNIDPVGDSIWLSRGTVVLDVVNFGREFNVDVLTSSDAEIQVCMNPRGFADTGCNNFNAPVTITFVLTSDTTSVLILPLGQMAPY